MKQFLAKWHLVMLFLMAYDAAAIVFSYGMAIFVRFDCSIDAIPQKYLQAYLNFMPLYIMVSLLVFLSLRLYQSIWSFASYRELLEALLATAITGVFHVFAISKMYLRMPITYFVVGITAQFLLTLGVRFIYRFVRLLRGSREANAEAARQAHIMIIGAGKAGQMLLRDIKNAKEVNEKVCCIIDDDPEKCNRFIDGVRIVGDRSSIPEACEKYKIDKIYYAIPSATPEERKQILEICSGTGCLLKQLPGMYQFITDQVTLSSMKDVDVEDLLGREPIRVNMEEIFAYIKGKVILVTGGGGSIGSELCRQIAAHEPKTLVIFDIYENNAYEIQMELRRKYPDLDLQVIIGSVRDSRRIFGIMETYRPQIVYHAAAHKHVPLMEDSPCEAIKNNAIGTYKTAYAAMTHGVERFVLISTDKAVNPTNIMGASKRLCEMIIQAFDAKIKAGKAAEIPQLFTHMHEEIWPDQCLSKDSPIPESHENHKIRERIELQKALETTKTEFVAVRFGNVLGSNGSVIPLFRKQIAEGGPVTVTHPDIIRYFMTIPEAVSLVLQAGIYAHGGEIFVLDMGEPVKIDTLARNLIRLSGYKPDVDIQVVYSGLRPGEKLFEEKLMAEEGIKKTQNKLIHIGCPIPFDEDLFLTQLDELMQKAYKNKPDMSRFVEKVVSTYHPETH